MNMKKIAKIKSNAKEVANVAVDLLLGPKGNQIVGHDKRSGKDIVKPVFRSKAFSAN